VYSSDDTTAVASRPAKLLVKLKQLLSFRKTYFFTILYFIIWRIMVSRGSSVSIVPDYGLDDRAIEARSRQGQRIFPLSSVSRPALGPTQPPVQWVPESFTRGKARPGREAHHSPPSSAEVVRSYTPLPPSASMECSGTALLFTYNSVSSIIYRVATLWNKWKTINSNSALNFYYNL
jgi:hypothetical protein